MNTVHGDDREPDRDAYTNEPVYDLGDMSADEPADETVADAQAARPPLPGQLATLFTPAALSLAGVIVAVLAAAGPLIGSSAIFSTGLSARPSTAWTVGPVAVSGLISIGLGLAAWRLALLTQAEVPRTAGAAVLLGGLVIVAALVLWTRPEPTALDVVTASLGG